MPFSMLKRGQWRYQLRRGGLPCEFKTFDYKPLPVISGFGGKPWPTAEEIRAMMLPSQS